MEIEVEALTLSQLSSGQLEVWSESFGKPLASALNPLLRAYFNPNVAEPIHFLDGTGGLPVHQEHTDRHVDHFLEIQHVVRMILDQQGITLQNICARPVGEWLRLSRFLNHNYNLYSITAAYNLYKSHIPFYLYGFRWQQGGVLPPDQVEALQFMKAYMQAKVDGINEHSTVRERILALCKAMKEAQGNNNYLCNLAGASIETFLNSAQSMKDKLKSGIFTSKR